MGVDIGMTVFVFVFMFMFVACLLLVRVGRRLVAEQRTPQFLAGHRAAGGDRQGEQLQRFFQLRAGLGHGGLVRVGAGGVFETDQVHRRAVQLQFEGLAVQRHVQLGDAVLVLAQAAVGVVMVVVVMGLGGERQQDEG